MSHPLIGRDEDLKKLRDEGYELDITPDGYVVVHNVPYLNSTKGVCRGILLCPVAPTDHTVLFCGEYPHKFTGERLESVWHSEMPMTIAGEMHVSFRFSNKPLAEGKYRDRHHMMTRYVEILGNEARAVDQSATAQTFRPIADKSDDAVFKYVDTASSRANIAHLASKFDGMKVAIVGLGGTGSYVLDLVSKTRVEEIHLHDGDTFALHNAYRAPGAPAFEELDTLPPPKKVDHLSRIYSRMKNGIVAHDTMLTEENSGQLSDMDFVFICMDGGPAKKVVIETLERDGVPFIDTGIGVREENGSLFGTVRVTASTTEKRDHVRCRIPFADPGEADVYASNIQIAELNSLAASLAVIKWKKLVGFYTDTKKEHHALYMMQENQLISEDDETSC